MTSRQTNAAAWDRARREGRRLPEHVLPDDRDDRREPDPETLEFELEARCHADVPPTL